LFSSACAEKRDAASSPISSTEPKNPRPAGT
jgi:hypothetical protein